jgi:hypothetical protein
VLVGERHPCGGCGAGGGPGARCGVEAGGEDVEEEALEEAQVAGLEEESSEGTAAAAPSPISTSPPCSM